MAGSSGKKPSGKGAMPLSWLWHEKDYNLENKLAEIELSYLAQYDYGRADIHAGPVKDSIRKEVDRMHKIMEIEHRIRKVDESFSELETREIKNG